MIAGSVKLRAFALRLARLNQDEILKELAIKHYDKNILKMSNAELLAEFGRGAKTLNKSLFIKNVIWQTYEKLKAGEKPFDIGNLRSFWYYIKDTMDRVGAKQKRRSISHRFRHVHGHGESRALQIPRLWL